MGLNINNIYTKGHVRALELKFLSSGSLALFWKKSIPLFTLRHTRAKIPRPFWHFFFSSKKSPHLSRNDRNFKDLLLHRVGTFLITCGLLIFKMSMHAITKASSSLSLTVGSKISICFAYYVGNFIYSSYYIYIIIWFNVFQILYI